MPSSNSSSWIKLVAYFSDDEVLSLHSLIAETDYRFESPSFRIQGDIIESELRRRGIAFDPIEWSISTNERKAG